MGLPPQTGYNLSSETTPPPPPKKKINPNFFQKNAMLNLLFQFCLLLYWRYHNKVFYWEPCFFFWGARTNIHRSLTPKENRKKNWRKLFNRGFFRRSSQPQSWKSAQNNARKQPQKIGQKNLGLPPKTGYNLSSETTPTPPPPPQKKKKNRPQFFSKKWYVKPIISISLLFFWRYHNKMLYWVPCFLCLGARTKKHRSLTPKKTEKQIGESSSIEAFFAVQVSHKPERVLKITHANNQKKIGQNKFGVASEDKFQPVFGDNPPPPPPKKKNPNFFQKNAMLNLLFQFFLLLYWRYHKKMLYWEPCFLFWGARTKKHRSLTPKENRKKIGENSSIEAFFAVQVSHNPERVLKITHANNQKKSAKKKFGVASEDRLQPVFGDNPTPPPPKKKVNPNFFSKKCYVKPIISNFLLLFWRYHNKMLYWEPCFLFWGARTKKHRSLTPKKTEKKIGENSSIEAFFAVQVSHKPERVLKITHANNQKKIGQKNLGLPPKTGYDLSSETTPSPPPPPK